MTNLELAKYWYYRIIDKYSKDNFAKSSKLGQQKNELEIYIINNDNYFKKQINIVEGVSLRLQAALFYGRDLEHYIQYLKSNEYKRIWNKEPDGLSYKKWLDQVAKKLSDTELLKVVRKRMKDYIYHNDDVNLVKKILSKEKKELVYIVPTIEQFSSAYKFYYKHNKLEGDYGPAKKELNNYENIIRKMEPLIADEFEKFLILIGIDYDKPNIINKKIESDYIRTIEKKEEWIKKIESEKKDTNRQLELTTKHLLAQIKKKRKIIFPKLSPSKEKMIELIDENRFKESQKVNCTAIGKILRRDPETIKRWIIKELGLESYAYPKN